MRSRAKWWSVLAIGGAALALAGFGEWGSVSTAAAPAGDEHAGASVASQEESTGDAEPGEGSHEVGPDRAPEAPALPGEVAPIDPLPREWREALGGGRSASEAEQLNVAFDSLPNDVKNVLQTKVKAAPGIYLIRAKFQNKDVVYVEASFNMREKLTKRTSHHESMMLKWPGVHFVVYDFPVNNSTDCRCLRFWQEAIRRINETGAPTGWALPPMDEEEYRVRRNTCGPAALRPARGEMLLGTALYTREQVAPRQTAQPLDPGVAQSTKVPEPTRSFFNGKLWAAHRDAGEVFVVAGGANPSGMSRRYLGSDVRGAHRRVMDLFNPKVEALFTHPDARIDVWTLPSTMTGNRACECLEWAEFELANRGIIFPQRRSGTLQQFLVSATDYVEALPIDSATHKHFTPLCQSLLAPAPKVYSLQPGQQASGKPTRVGPAPATPSTPSIYGDPPPNAAPVPTTPPRCKLPGIACVSDNECCADGYSESPWTGSSSWYARCVAGFCRKPKCLREGQACNARDESDNKHWLNKSCCHDGKSEGMTPDGQSRFRCVYTNSTTYNGSCQR